MPTATRGDQTCPDDHNHGIDTVCYLHHMCGCVDCKAGMARRARERRAARKAGTYARGRVDAKETREKLAWLRGQGLGVKQIEHETRVPRIVLQGICWGAIDHDGRRYERRTITARYAARILALTPQLHMYADGAKIPSQGTQRRIEALGCLGWTHAAIARHCGLTDRRVTYITHADRVTARLARKIAAAYDELWNTHPSPRTAQEREQVRRTLARAKTFGWAPPLAWDDIDNDDAPQQPEPTAENDVIAIALAVSGGSRVQLTRAERKEAVRQLNALHRTDKQIAAMLGCTEQTVLRDRREIGAGPAVGHDRQPIIRTRAA